MKLKQQNIIKSTLLFSLVLICACSSDPLSPGVEYMPDMYRSPAIEEYVDYGEMQDKIVDSVANKLSARQTVEGTIPFSEDRSKALYNFPYPYQDNDSGYQQASLELVNPIAFTEVVYEEGKEIYTNFCIHCHGEKGLGKGSITTTGENGGVYPAPPAYPTIDRLTQGKMFHTLHYGRNNMGSHASQLTKEERWKVVHYVQTLVDEQYSNPFKAAPDAEEESGDNIEDATDSENASDADGAQTVETDGL